MKQFTINRNYFLENLKQIEIKLRRIDCNAKETDKLINEIRLRLDNIFTHFTDNE